MYVDAFYNKKKDEIQVVERIKGERIQTSYPAEYVFYYEDGRGRYRTFWDEPCSKMSFNSFSKFHKELKYHEQRFKIHESDINPIFRCLHKHYKNVEAPELNIGFFDIEADFDPDKGYAKPDDPFAKITSITIYLSHLDKLITLVIKPELPENDKHYLSWEKAEEITLEFEDCILCNSEKDMLELFLDIIHDVDLLTGWNSSGYDIPYMVNRIERILGKEYTKKFCLFGQYPKKRKYIKFKKEQETYDLIGRVHLDYLDLYRKHNTQELHSYKLDFVGAIEIGENKTVYEGSLDQLYKRDFKKFIEYNRQDVMILVKIDRKHRYIELANQLAHSTTILLSNTTGSVTMIEQAIINEAWELGKQIPNRPKREFKNDDDPIDDEETEPVVGAYVAQPKVGIHEYIGCIDINSLYPSVLRALNMGTETLIGQIRTTRTDNLVSERMKTMDRKDVWLNIFATIEFDMVHEKSDEMLVVDFEDGSSTEISGRDLYSYIYEQGNKICLSANGTIFRTDNQAVIPGLLGKWYSERKQMQSVATVYEKLIGGIEIDEELINLLS